jgi:hypothetical protein
MAQLAWIVVFLALAGAFASWIAGAWFYARALAAERRQTPRAGALLAVIAWPFALGRIKGAAAAHATKVNKALVAVLACLTVAAAAMSVATNLARVSRPAANG